MHLYTRRSLAATLAELGFERIAVRAVGGLPLLKRLLLATAVQPAT